MTRSSRTPDPDSVVVVPVANMYSGAAEDSDVVSQAIIGTNVVTLETDDQWARVHAEDGYPGWMRRDLLRPHGEPRGYGGSGPVIQVESLFANLYRESDVTKHQPLLTVPFESRLEVADDADREAGRWLKVRLPDRRTAWIQSGDGNRDPRPLTISESIELARRFLGLPYLWGGRSSYGFDCSGFTQMLVRRRGITMPRDAHLQAAWEGAVEVPRKDLRAGDLLFFGPSVEKINHTALYIGKGEFIHSTAQVHPGVQISRLDEPHSTRNLVSCRRVKSAPESDLEGRSISR